MGDATPLPQSAHPRGVQKCTGPGGKPRREKKGGEQEGRQRGARFFEELPREAGWHSHLEDGTGIVPGRLAPDPVHGGRASRTRETCTQPQAGRQQGVRQAGGMHGGPRKYRDRKRGP